MRKMIKERIQTISIIFPISTSSSPLVNATGVSGDQPGNGQNFLNNLVIESFALIVEFMPWCRR